MNSLLHGAVSGAAATVPMSVFMFAAHASLPRKEQYPLPPREIVDEIAEKAGVMNPPESVAQAATWISHFGYGSAMGVVYAGMKNMLPGNTFTKGISFGSLVWLGSYAGMLPAMKILKPVSEHPLRRTALMLSAHFIWGAALAATAAHLEHSSS